MTRVKICGLTRAEDVVAALEAGADMLGFIHVPGSPRFVSPSEISRLLAVAGGRAETVIVVRNADEQTLSALRRNLDFDLFQFHGTESPEQVKAHRGYKVIHIKGHAPDQETIRPYGEPFLLDTQLGHRQGGTGVAFDWEIIPTIPGRFLVAGGLTPENAAALVQGYRPWGVDVSSGIESAPGIKDHSKLLSFIRRVQEA